MEGKGMVTYENTENGLTVRLCGEIDHHSAIHVRTGIDGVLLQNRPENVLLDLSRVDFMDSSGLGLMMGRFALVKRYGGKFAVLNPSTAVQKMLNLGGMQKLIPVRFIPSGRNKQGS